MDKEIYSKSNTEKLLVIALIDGNEAAFCKLYALYKDRLIYFAMKFIKSRDIAEDVFQDAFIAIWQNRHFLNPELPFSSYIYTIIKNRILNLLSDLDKDQRLKDYLISNAIDYTNETENDIIDTELNKLLEKALLSLTPQQKRVFEMSRKDMKSHKEIANELQISVYTVQQHISASLKIIRGFLLKYGEAYTGILLIIFHISNR